MTTQDEYPHRIERLRVGIERLGADEAVLGGADHVTHLCGYSRYLAGPSAVVLTRDGRRVLIVARYEFEAASQSAEADDVITYGGDDFLDFNPAPSIARACRSVLSSRKVGVSGLFSELAAALSELGVEGTDAADVVTAVRLVKDGDELVAMAESRVHALKGQNAIDASTKPGERDLDLFTAGWAAAQTSAGVPVEFVGSVASGVHTAEVAPPVYVPGGKQVEPGDPILSDVAVRVNGYWSDTTRTTIVGENDEATGVRDEIASILEHSAGALRTGTSVSEFYGHLRDQISDRFPDGWFPHHGGHSLGLSVGENPQIIPTEQSVMRTGMVFAVEPGVYFPGRFGVRVEDMYRVTDGGGVRIDVAAAGGSA
jgi:Xaa-Pro dipeptidase